MICPELDKVIKEMCLEIEKRSEIKFIEIGTDKDHMHFLIQSVSRYHAKKIIQIVKSITRQEKEYQRIYYNGQFKLF